MDTVFLPDTWCIPWTCKVLTVVCDFAFTAFCLIISTPAARCHSLFIFSRPLLLVLFALIGISLSQQPHFHTWRFFFFYLLHHLHFHFSAHARLSDFHTHCRSAHRKTRYQISLPFLSRHALMFFMLRQLQWAWFMHTRTADCAFILIMCSYCKKLIYMLYHTLQ